MSNARERRFHWVLVGAVLVVALVVVVRVTYDALASPVRPTPLQVNPDDELARARAYNRRLEKILHREVSRAERNERRLLSGRRAMRRALGTSPIGNHPLEAAFQCIHQHEGSWRDPGLPYFGGLQMDLDFQRAYGRDYLRYFGTADHWPMSVQVAVAIRGYISRGFTPWPNTRRMCGL